LQKEAAYFESNSKPPTSARTHNWITNKKPAPGNKGESKMSATTAAQTGNIERTGPRTQKITTFLWFDNNAEEAVNFYVSVFKNSKILQTTRYGEAGPGPKGSVMTISFELDGQEFAALNGGPQFKFTEAISLVVHC